MVMPPHRLLLAARSILLGWIALLLITFLLERPLFIWTAPWLGAGWILTERLGLSCLVLAATGWIVGRWHRRAPMLGLLAFAATLTFRDFAPELALNVPWLLRLTADALGDSTYLGAWGETLGAHTLMFGSLIAGGLLSRPSQEPLSIVDSPGLLK
jgi:hypothetical protein